LFPKQEEEEERPAFASLCLPLIVKATSFSSINKLNCPSIAQSKSILNAVFMSSHQNQIAPYFRV
jgi:hypothetical protein